MVPVKKAMSSLVRSSNWRYGQKALGLLAVWATQWLFFTSASQAAIIITEGQQLHPPVVLVNFPDQVTMSSGWSGINATSGAHGEFDHSGLFLHFNGYDGRGAGDPTKPGQTPLYLHTQHGTAFIEPVASPLDTSTHPDMYTMTICAPVGYALTGIDFFADYNNHGDPGTISISVYDLSMHNLLTSSFAIKPEGENKFKIEATGNSAFTSIVIQTSDSAPLIDLKQIDIKEGGVVPAVPEPSSLLIATVLGLSGLCWRVRRMTAKPRSGNAC